MKQVIGDCEVCDKVDIPVTREHGNILMCADCRTVEQAAVARDKAAKQVIQDFRATDSAIQTKQDIFNAKTVAAIELRGAIQNNSEIPEEAKELAFMEECKTHFLHFQALLFKHRQETIEIENEMKMWQTQGQMSAGKVRIEARKGYELFDVNYKPEPVKKIKPAVIKVPQTSAKQLVKEAREAAAKYGLEDMVSMIRMHAVSDGTSAEEAAKKLVAFRDKAKLAGKV